MHFSTGASFDTAELVGATFARWLLHQLIHPTLNFQLVLNEIFKIEELKYYPFDSCTVAVLQVQQSNELQK